MRCVPLLILPLALALAADAGADVFKCRTRDGKTVISSDPCPGDSRTEAVRQAETITPEQRREAEKRLARDRELLAEKEKARAEEEARQQDSQRRLAEEDSARKTRCLDNAQREPDPIVRADLIAACNGVAPQRPAVVQQPVYVPVPVRGQHPPQTPSAVQICVGKGCTTTPPAPPPSPPSPQATGKPRIGPGPSGQNCRTVGSTLRCD